MSERHVNKCTNDRNRYQKVLSLYFCLRKFLRIITSTHSLTPRTNDSLQFTNAFCAFNLLIESKSPEILKPCDKDCASQIRKELFCSLRPPFTTVSNELWIKTVNSFWHIFNCLCAVDCTALSLLDTD